MRRGILATLLGGFLIGGSSEHRISLFGRMAV